MVFTNFGQLYDLFLYAGVGFWLCLYQDIFRLIRCTAHPKAAAVFLLDLLFCLSGGCAVFLASLAIDSGRIRLLELAALGGGFAAARFTISRLVMAVALRVIHLVRRITRCLAAAYEKMTRPIRRQIIRCGHAFQNKIRLFLQKKRKKQPLFQKKGLQDSLTMVYNDNQE